MCLRGRRKGGGGGGGGREKVCRCMCVWGGGGGGEVGVGIEHSVMASIYHSVPQIRPPPPPSRISPPAFLVQSLANVFLSHPPEEDSSRSRNIDHLSHLAVYR